MPVSDLFLGCLRGICCCVGLSAQLGQVRFESGDLVVADVDFALDFELNGVHDSRVDSLEVVSRSENGALHTFTKKSHN
jgi:hypothetical protein